MCEEITSLERVQDLGRLELMMLRLPELVGSPLSVNNLRENLQVSHKTAAGWLEILERLYAVFRLPPFGSARIRAVKKEQKHYHFDWTLVGERGPRFENLVAAHLLKWVHFQQDARGRDVELRYFRDTDHREVDFVVVEKRGPILLVECKWGDAEVDRSLRYLKERFAKAEAWHQRDGKEGLPDAGRDPGGARRRAPAGTRLRVNDARGGKLRAYLNADLDPPVHGFARDDDAPLPRQHRPRSAASS